MSVVMVTLRLACGALLPVLTAAVCGRWMAKLPSWEEGAMDWVLAWLGLLCCAWYVFDLACSSFELGKKLGEIAWIEREGEAHLKILQKFVDEMQEEGGEQ